MWKPNNIYDWYEILGTIICLVAAILLSSNVNQEGLAYALFFVGTAFFCILFYHLKRSYLLILNILYLLINSWGIWRWLVIKWVQ
jgi:hypothetical protein